jgi:pyruvate kinase
METGMNVARINFSHGTHEQHTQTIQHLRDKSKQLRRPVAILQDLSGPKLRIGKLKGDTLDLKEGNEYELTARQRQEKDNEIPVSLAAIPKALGRGERLLLGDGILELEVMRGGEDNAVCRVTKGGRLCSHQGISLPESQLDIPVLTEKDRKDIRFGVSKGVDFIAVSFIRTANDILQVRRYLDKRRAESVALVAKIERKDALTNIDEIIQVADAIMVARGDLGLEAPLEQVPLAQKMIITKCNRMGVPVITATQMLESMIENARPTRAEVTDVANAILDGTDALMLSAETAVGKYPVETVAMMDKIARETENTIDHKQILANRAPTSDQSVADAISFATCHIAASFQARAIVTYTSSGSTARMVARYRPLIPILAKSPREVTIRQLALSWGVVPIRSREVRTTDQMIRRAKATAVRTGFVGKGDRIIITAGIPFGVAGTTNLIKVERIT